MRTTTEIYDEGKIFAEGILFPNYLVPTDLGFTCTMAVIIRSWIVKIGDKSGSAYYSLTLYNDHILDVYEGTNNYLVNQVRQTFPDLNPERMDRLLDFLVKSRMPIAVERKVMISLDDKLRWSYALPKVQAPPLPLEPDERS